MIRFEVPPDATEAFCKSFKWLVGYYAFGSFSFSSLFPGIKAVRLLGTGKARLGPVDGDTARASPVPGGQGLHGVGGGSSNAAFPLPRCRGRRRLPLSVWRGRRPSAAPLRRMMRQRWRRALENTTGRCGRNDERPCPTLLAVNRNLIWAYKGSAILQEKRATPVEADMY